MHTQLHSHPNILPTFQLSLADEYAKPSTDSLRYLQGDQLTCHRIVRRLQKKKEVTPFRLPGSAPHLGLNLSEAGPAACCVYHHLDAVFRIHNILVWIRIRIRLRGSMRLTNGTFTMPAKNSFFNTIFPACYFLKVHLHYFSTIKSQKESQNRRIQDFSYYFCLMIAGSGSGSRAGSGSIALISASASGRPKNT